MLIKRDWIAAVVSALVLSCAAITQASAKQTVEVAFVLDTTGSMGPLIEGAKRKIWAIATSIFDANPNAEIRMGLVAYRDIGDDYVTKRFDLTTDIQDLYGKLLGLQAQGGGDWPESVNEALDVAVNKLSWSRGSEACRILFLVGDAPPHMDYAQDTKYPQTLAVARQKDIVVNTVMAGDARDTERVWREIAQRGNGDFLPIPQDGGHVVVIETPYDDDIIILQRSINKTVMPYGPAPMQQKVVDKARQVDSVAAAAPSSASDMASFINKHGKAANEAVTGDGDLVADYAAGRAKLDQIKDDELPPALRNLPKPERSAALEQQSNERKELNAKLSELVAKRDAYIAEQQTKQQPRTSTFDQAVAATLKAQIK
jgi:von Willebrand factor type A domain